MTSNANKKMAIDDIFILLVSPIIRQVKIEKGCLFIKKSGGDDENNNSLVRFDFAA